MSLNIFGKLPKEIIHIILSYNNTINYRNGKYINRICPSRYHILDNIPRPIINSIYSHDEISLRLTVSFLCPFKNIRLEKIECSTSIHWSGTMIFNNDQNLSIITTSGGYSYNYIKVKTYQWYIWSILHSVSDSWSGTLLR